MDLQWQKLPFCYNYSSFTWGSANDKTDPSVSEYFSEVLVSLMYGTRGTDHKSHRNCLNTTQTYVNCREGTEEEIQLSKLRHLVPSEIL